MGQSSGEIIALAIVFPLLSLFAVCLRIWARRTKRQALAWDDYLIFVAMVNILSPRTIVALLIVDSSS